MRSHVIKNTIVGTLLFSWILLFSGYPPAMASAEGWRFTTPCASNPGEEPVIARNGYLYTFGIGGYQWTTIDPKGTLGNWTTVLVTLYLGIRPGVATTSNLIYVAGGRTSSDGLVPPQNQLWYAGFNPDGSLVNIVVQDNPKLQTRRWFHSSLILKGRLYCFGGYSNSYRPAGALASVEFGSINSDSSVGPFQYTSSFSQISGAVFIAFNSGDTVYCFGSNPSQSTTYLEEAVLNPDGTLSPWILFAGPFPFAGPTVLTSRTTLFLVQNYNISTTPQPYNVTYKSGFNPTVGINNFLSASHTLTPRYNSIIATWNRFVFQLGGQNPNPPYDYYNSVELYDPDLADTTLFPDSSMVFPSQSMHILEIPSDVERKNE